MTAVKSWHFFSCTYALSSVWAPLLLTFVQIGILLLFYVTICFHLGDKSVFVCSVYAAKKLSQVWWNYQNGNLTVFELFSALSGVTAFFVLKCHCKAGEQCQRILRLRHIIHCCGTWATADKRLSFRLHRI